MRLYTKLFVGALAATALFASLATSASARNISISNRNIRTVFTPLVLDPSIGGNISCTVTLEGTFHSNTIAKVANSLIGYITRASVDTPNCVQAEGNSRALVRQESLPWHIRYRSFEGALPNVTLRIQLINAGFDLLGTPVGTCRYTASPLGIIGGASGGNIGGTSTTLAAENGVVIPSSTPFCPSGQFSSAPTPVTLLGTTTAITVRLI
jgi:hypothetical protein